ncbi:MAG: cysteine desulfurase [Eubacterium sp.]|nr:cysteine desulfurase [Eubacterium sp.]
MSIYFDNAATTKTSESVREVMQKVMDEDFGNPSSLHIVGVNAEKYIKNAQEVIAETLKVEPKEIYFTSGGTEANNMAIIGAAMANKRSGKKIITTQVEHPSVASPMKYLEEQGFEVVYLPVDENGVVSKETFERKMDEDTILVSIMHVNNEVGAVMPIEEIGKIAKSINPSVVYHVDAIQSYGKYEIRPKKCNIDLLTVSGHKIHGPKGVGFIYIRKGTKINPILLGGGQQLGMRSGTENVPGIAGLAKAAQEAYDGLNSYVNQMVNLKDYMIDSLNAMGERLDKDGDVMETLVNGNHTITVNSQKGSDGAPHIVSVSFRNVGSEVMLHALEDKEIYISAGSACSSNKPAVSETLKAMNVDKGLLKSTVRFSFNRNNTKEEVDEALKAIEELIPLLSKFVRR